MREIDIKNFYSLAKTKIDLIEQVRHYFGKETSPRFNSFDFWWIDENKVSQILAFFLDPNQNHEQGDIYLKHFIEKFKLEFFKYEASDKIYVECEHRTGNGRRIDIMIYKNMFESAIGIENKINPLTADQDGQLKDYNDFLEERTKGSYSLIYLSPQEKSVAEHSISAEDKKRLEGEGKLKCVSYEKDMIDCVAEFAMMTESIRVRSFLKDFQKTLIKTYMGQKDLEAKQAVVDLINESSENLEISFMVLQSLPEVKESLKEMFKSQVERIMSETGLIKVEDDGLNFRPSNWKDYCISISIDRTEVYYGISHYDLNDDNTKLIQVVSFIRNQLNGNFLSNDLWPIYEFLQRNIENSPDLWLDIKNDKATIRIKEFVKLLNDNFNTDEY